jgi:hypothetical protein
MDAPTRFLLEFVGGYWDGKTIDSASQDADERDRVWQCLWLTENGMVGRAYMGVSPAGIEYLKEHGPQATRDAGFRISHVYRIAERLEEGNEVLIRLKYEQLE